MSQLTTGYKLFTHDFRSPLQGGNTIWDGSVPFELPKVQLDRSGSECGAGWNYCESIEQAWKIAGMWSVGRPNVAVQVQASDDAIEQGNKRRCSQLNIVKRCDESELRAALNRFSIIFGDHAQTMADSQWEWMLALARPRHNVRDVERGLRAALKTRGLDWKLNRFDNARDARDARAAWAARDARAAWAAWDARAAWDAWAAWDARAAWDAWAARAAWDAWAARAAWDARDARAACTIQYAVLQGWIDNDSLLLTIGIRDAYIAGLEIVIPTGPKELGWVMSGSSV